MTADDLLLSLELKPPNFREALDYRKEPLAPRCFNCEYLTEENMTFHCSLFMIKTSVYNLCDAWKLKEENYISKADDNSSMLVTIANDTGRKTEPLLLVSREQSEASGEKNLRQHIEIETA
ncbi:MAG: hypothetical protein ACYCQJ_00185 [Nitrososphaerales archaeon]